jgi:hypothetical protein
MQFLLLVLLIVALRKVIWYPVAFVVGFPLVVGGLIFHVYRKVKRA